MNDTRVEQRIETSGDIIAFRISPLPPPTVPLPLIRGAQGLSDIQSSTVSVKDFSRIHLIFVGQDVQVRGTCNQCHHCIFEKIIRRYGDPFVFDLLCPMCDVAFCRVGDTEQEIPASIVVKCICQQERETEDLIFCESCETWQHSSCYYDGIQTATHQCISCRPIGNDILTSQ
jgi:hypothetical protein